MRCVVFTVSFYFFQKKIDHGLESKAYKVIMSGDFLKILFFLLFIAIFSTNAHAQYYDTLPKGVRMVMGKFIQSNVESSFNQSQSETPYAYDIDSNIQNLEKIDNQMVQDALSLFASYPDAYSKLSLGTHSLEANAQVNVDVYAFGYGITDRITAYMGIPIYNAKVNLDYGRRSNSSQKEVAETLQKLYGDNWAQFLGNAVEQLYNIDEGVLQSAIVNTLGYDELGSWEAQGLGDIELGVMYNFIRESRWGLMVTTGVVAPTGYVDDPDIIQDIGFGDGQWDYFLEFGGGYRLSSKLVLNAWGRYNYQLESQKALRTPYSSKVPLSDITDVYTEKLGNQYTLSTSLEYSFNDWLKVIPEYIYKSTDKAQYDSDNALANDLLAQGTESYSHNAKILAQLSSVDLYLKKQFLLPAKLLFSYQAMLNGRNTPKANLTELSFQMFF